RFQAIQALIANNPTYIPLIDQRHICILTWFEVRAAGCQCVISQRYGLCEFYQKVPLATMYDSSIRFVDPESCHWLSDWLKSVGEFSRIKSLLKLDCCSVVFEEVDSIPHQLKPSILMSSHCNHFNLLLLRSGRASVDMSSVAQLLLPHLVDVLTTLVSTSTTYCSFNIKSIIVLKILQPNDTSHGTLAWPKPSQACDGLTPTWACAKSGLACAQRPLAIGQAYFRVGQARLAKNHPNLMECPAALDTQYIIKRRFSRCWKFSPTPISTTRNSLSGAPVSPILRGRFFRGSTPDILLIESRHQIGRDDYDRHERQLMELIRKPCKPIVCLRRRAWSQQQHRHQNKKSRHLKRIKRPPLPGIPHAAESKVGIARRPAIKLESCPSGNCKIYWRDTLASTAPLAACSRSLSTLQGELVLAPDFGAQKQVSLQSSFTDEISVDVRANKYVMGVAQPLVIVHASSFIQGSLEHKNRKTMNKSSLHPGGHAASKFHCLSHSVKPYLAEEPLRVALRSSPMGIDQKKLGDMTSIWQRAMSNKAAFTARENVSKDMTRFGPLCPPAGLAYLSPEPSPPDDDPSRKNRCPLQTIFTLVCVFQFNSPKKPYNMIRGGTVVGADAYRPISLFHRLNDLSFSISQTLLEFSLVCLPITRPLLNKSPSPALIFLLCARASCLRVVFHCRLVVTRRSVSSQLHPNSRSSGVFAFDTFLAQYFPSHNIACMQKLISPPIFTKHAPNHICRTSAQLPWMQFLGSTPGLTVQPSETSCPHKPRQQIFPFLLKRHSCIQHYLSRSRALSKMITRHLDLLQPQVLDCFLSWPDRDIQGQLPSGGIVSTIFNRYLRVIDSFRSISRPDANCASFPAGIMSAQAFLFSPSHIFLLSFLLHHLSLDRLLNLPAPPNKKKGDVLIKSNFSNLICYYLQFFFHIHTHRNLIRPLPEHLARQFRPTRAARRPRQRQFLPHRVSLTFTYLFIYYTSKLDCEGFDRKGDHVLYKLQVPVKRQCASDIRFGRGPHVYVHDGAPLSLILNPKNSISFLILRGCFKLLIVFGMIYMALALAILLTLQRTQSPAAGQELRDVVAQPRSAMCWFTPIYRSNNGRLHCSSSLVNNELSNGDYSNMTDRRSTQISFNAACTIAPVTIPAMTFRLSFLPLSAFFLFFFSLSLFLSFLLSSAGSDILDRYLNGALILTPARSNLQSADKQDLQILGVPTKASSYPQNIGSICLSTRALSLWNSTSILGTPSMGSNHWLNSEVLPSTTSILSIFYYYFSSSIPFVASSDLKFLWRMMTDALIVTSTLICAPPSLLYSIVHTHHHACTKYVLSLQALTRLEKRTTHIQYEKIV
ncbi:hypothetical protein VP01_743g1, partial [Puccinia sorghi]